MSASTYRVVVSMFALGCLCAGSSLEAFTLDPAAKIATTNGSQSDVQSAINSATVTLGWTVAIPSGNFSWSSTVTIEKGIHLKGAGASSTTISGSAAPRLLLEKQFDQIIEISDLSFATFPANQPEGKRLSILIGGLWTARPFVIHDCMFNLNGDQAIRVETNGGLIYNCTFNGSFHFNDQAVQHKDATDSLSWSSVDTIGVRDVTGTRNLYVEDSIFNSMPLQAMDFDDASRVVVRHSRFTNSAITSHGVDTSAVGMRHFEIYNNVFDYTFAVNDPNAQDVGYFMYIRGGTGVVVDNAIDDIRSEQWNNKGELLLTVFSINRTGQIPCQTEYPAFRQLGQNYDGSKYFTDPLRIWNNTGGGNYLNPDIVQYSEDQCGNGESINDYLQLNRDYFLSARPGYSKYTYPHPLREDASGAPTAPGNLRIIP